MARIAVFIVLAFALAGPPAAAQNEDKWGAIAFGGPERASGWAVDYPSAAEAREAAFAACGGRCTQAIIFLRECAAIAESPSGAGGISTNRWRGRAIARALAQCGSPDCSLTVWACTRH